MKKNLLFLFITVFSGVLFQYKFSGAEEPDYRLYFSPLPKEVENSSNPLNKDKIELGKMLFFDPRLSKSSIVSCATCHNLSSGGVDNLPASVGHRWQTGARNAPTVLNAALLSTQFWDGRAKNVEEQAKGPILNPMEMASTESLAVKRVGSIPQYAGLFQKAFKDDPEPVSFDNIANALAAFERTLLTPSRFDRFLEGDKGSLTEDEVKGLNIFITRGCVLCHNGAAIGGGSFQKFDYGSDPGRFNVTKKESDRSVFRVASLRNVELTYPYFHDGKVSRLEEAIRIMAEKQLRTKLTNEEARLIAAFLKSLTGEARGIALPELPPSTETTPPPDLN